MPNRGNLKNQTNSIKVLLDTDIGSDIDDAICLAYLLSQSKCELLGITTVTGEANKRAMLASVLCKVSGRKIPIFPGNEQPRAISQIQTTVPQAAALSKWDHDTEFLQGQAIEFLRHTVHQHPNEIILLAVGPLTKWMGFFAYEKELGGMPMNCMGNMKLLFESINLSSSNIFSQYLICRITIPKH